MHGISGVKVVFCSHVFVDKNILSFQQCFFLGCNCDVTINDNWISRLCFLAVSLNSVN